MIAITSISQIGPCSLGWWFERLDWLFLLDPSPINVYPYWLTQINVTLADEDGYSIIVDDLTSAVLVSTNNSWSLVEILRLKFGRDFEFWSRFVNLRRGRSFEAELCSRFWVWSLVEPLKLKFGQGSEAKSESRFVLELVIWNMSSNFDESTQPLGSVGSVCCAFDNVFNMILGNFSKKRSFLWSGWL